MGKEDVVSSQVVCDTFGLIKGVFDRLLRRCIHVSLRYVWVKGCIPQTPPAMHTRELAVCLV
ncbi:MAG: hypothetical protein LUD00_10590 [Prevotellaceae bacterium]|nr:hypothetical protein [Prevotellaceae bacterium]